MITSVVDGQQVSWTDRKRYLWPLGLVVPLLPLAARDGLAGHFMVVIVVGANCRSRERQRRNQRHRHRSRNNPHDGTQFLSPPNATSRLTVR